MSTLRLLHGTPVVAAVLLAMPYKRELPPPNPAVAALLDKEDEYVPVKRRRQAAASAAARLTAAVAGGADPVAAVLAEAARDGGDGGGAGGGGGFAGGGDSGGVAAVAAGPPGSGSRFSAVGGAAAHAAAATLAAAVTPSTEGVAAAAAAAAGSPAGANVPGGAVAPAPVAPAAKPPAMPVVDPNRTLLEQAPALRAATAGLQSNALERLAAQEAAIMADLAAKKALRSVGERAKDVSYTEPMPSSWKPPRFLLEAGEAHHEAVRKKNYILVEGANVPPPCVSFHEMKLPPVLLSTMRAKGIKKPSPIQMQGLPVALAGRDMIGIAFTGSGKTLAFALPAVLAAWEAEARLPLTAGEGPIALLICPSRELARQTRDVVQGFFDDIAGVSTVTVVEDEVARAKREKRERKEWRRLERLRRAARAGGGSGGDGDGDGDRRGGSAADAMAGGQVGAGAEMRALLAIGGAPVDLAALKKGVHAVVATPGRLLDLLRKKRIHLDACKVVCLDEADRLIDLGFEEDIRAVFDYFSAQRQTLMFSATMPSKIQAFAASALVQPVVVNVGRAGAAALDIIQEVEVVPPQAKTVHLLSVLQKTPPPVLVFAENKRDVDDIHEYLLSKGVDAVSIHGGKDQEEREAAMSSFRAGKQDILVATDVAAKGIDFPAIKHVVNYDMPKEIENYVHRIGRTGRGGKTGVATTFVNATCSATILMDLKQLLIEAKQRVPAGLIALERDALGEGADAYAATEVGGVKGCAFCGGLGHRVNACPKLETERMKALAGGGSGGGERYIADRGGTRAYGGDW
ncbi:hypothetical protein I4F81_005152 [Pyropia yezoensis]|uniref:Uncharacterized protein n=1 Tax=Pyropia yezoensis TaxID=2788 RepID=A0ACC3BY02_PYRYE|nr:hypothetical protein I4F81_005152 [Neopyropia yezoensis]